MPRPTSSSFPSRPKESLWFSTKRWHGATRGRRPRRRADRARHTRDGLSRPTRDTPGRGERYADAIERLLDDSGLRHRMGSAAKVRIEQTSASNSSASELQELLELAQQLRRDEPRPVPGRGLGRASATEAIELTRANASGDALRRSAAEARRTPTRAPRVPLYSASAAPVSLVGRTRRPGGCRRCVTPFAAADGLLTDDPS